MPGAPEGENLQRALVTALSLVLLAAGVSGCLFSDGSKPRTRPGLSRITAPEIARDSKQNMYPPKKHADRMPQGRGQTATRPQGPLIEDRLPQQDEPPEPRQRLAAREEAPTDDRLPQERTTTGRDRSGMALGQFFKALQELESGRRRSPVTILHLGDSHIAADRFSGDMRNYFQARFGNAGRGLVLPGNPYGYSHSRGVKTVHQGEWKVANSQRGHAGYYGLTGISLTSDDPEAALIMRASNRAFDHVEATLLTGPNMGRARLETDRESKTVNLSSSRIGLKRVRFSRRSRTLRVRPAGEEPITVLSWASGANRPGIRYLNLGIPGASMLTTKKWNTRLYTAQVRRLQPDLIILAYGTNEGFNDKLNLDAYQRYYRQFVRRLKDAAPLASFLIIGPPDGARLPRFADREDAGCKPLSNREIRSYSADMSAQSPHLARWHAPPKLAAVRSALKRIAARINAGFWDWSKVMGRNCGIHKWAEASPKKAVSDHVHLTSLGAKSSAKMLFNDLMNQYVSHKKLARRAQ